MIFDKLLELAGVITSLPLVIKLLGLLKLPIVEYAKMVGSYFFSNVSQVRGESRLGNKYIKESHFNSMVSIGSSQSRIEKKQAKLERKKILANMSKVEKMKYLADERKAKKIAKASSVSGKIYTGVKKITHVGVAGVGAASSVLGAAAYHSYSTGNVHLAGLFGGGALVSSGLAAYPGIRASRKLASEQPNVPTSPSAEASNPSVQETLSQHSTKLDNLDTKIQDLADMLSGKPKEAPSVSVEQSPSQPMSSSRIR